jgi:hypothetical protein
MWHVRDIHPSGSSRPCVRSNRNGFRAEKHILDTRTTLHVAAACGTRPEVVQYLTQLQPATAQWQDSCGRTPLHLNTEFCCVEHSCDGTAFANETDEERTHRQALALHELEFGGGG